MMLWGAVAGALELRATEGGVRLTGRFPYGVETELAPGRSERIDAGAFRDKIEVGADIHLLSGHDYEKPLASRAAGTLHLTDQDDALVFEATLAGGTTWAADFLAAHRAGLIRGLSPGFRVPAGGERIERRRNGLLRVINVAELFELSAVTRPAYPTAQIEARAWQATEEAPDAGLVRTFKRWRL